LTQILYYYILPENNEFSCPANINGAGYTGIRVLWFHKGMGNNIIIAKKHFLPNTVLCQKGEICKEIFFLLKGAIQVSDEDNIIKTIKDKGTFIGELTPLLQEPRTTTLTAVEDSDCIVIPVDLLNELISKAPHEGVNLLHILADNLLKASEEFMKIQKTTEGLETKNSNENVEIINLRKIYLIAATGTFLKALNYHFKPLGFEVIYFSDPVKMIQELGSNYPDMIIFNAVNFPRHWKPLLKIIREEKSYEETIFIIITEKNFPFEEAAKAAYLRVNGIVPQNLLDKAVISQLFELLKRYKSINEKRKFIRLIPKAFEKYKFIFAHPIRKALVSGIVTDISLEGASFKPSNPDLTSDLEVNTRIPKCTLRIGENIITIDSLIVRNDEELGLLFESFNEDDHEKLFQYLMHSSDRELEHSK
jgi:hypothetical protein